LKDIKKKLTLIFIFNLLILLYGNTTNEALLNSDQATNIQINSASTNLKIITSISIVKDFVQNIVGDLTEIGVIVSGTQDIHTFPGPNEAQKIELSQSDVFFVMGLEGLEPWLNDTLNSLGENAPLTIRLVNNSMLKYDDVIQSINPHVWMDPNNVKKMVNNITLELQQLDTNSTNDLIYSNNNQTYQDKLDQLISRIEGNATIFTGKKVIVNHPAFKYLLDLLGIIRVDALEKVEGEEPTSSDIQKLIETVQEQNVDLLINVQWAEQNDFYEIARETNLKIAELVPLLGGVDQNNNPITSYIQMIDYNLWALSNPISPPSSIPGYFIELIFISTMIPSIVFIVLIILKNNSKVANNKIYKN